MNLLESQIQRELQGLDRDLFLDKEIARLGEFSGAIMYCVKYNVGSGHPPLRVLDWHSAGVPLPLSPAIIDRVKMFEGDITDAIAEVKRNNEQKKLEVIHAFEETVDEIAQEFEKSSKVLHRSGPWKPKYDVTAYRPSEKDKEWQKRAN